MKKSTFTFGHYFILALVLMGLYAALSGCATLESKAGDAVDIYCDNTTDTDQQALRERLDKATEPHTVRIECQRNQPDTGNYYDAETTDTQYTHAPEYDTRTNGASVRNTPHDIIQNRIREIARWEIPICFTGGMGKNTCQIQAQLYSAGNRTTF